MLRALYMFGTMIVILADDLLETHVAVPKAQTINLSLLARRCISNCKSHQPQQM